MSPPSSIYIPPLPSSHWPLPRSSEHWLQHSRHSTVHRNPSSWITRVYLSSLWNTLQQQYKNINDQYKTTTVNSSPVVISLSLVEGMTVVELSTVFSSSSGDGFFTVKRVSLFQFRPRCILQMYNISIKCALWDVYLSKRRHTLPKCRLLVSPWVPKKTNMCTPCKKVSICSHQ